MLKKKVFLSAMNKDEKAVAGLFARIKAAGFDITGHFWSHEEKELTKVLPAQEVENVDAWVIYASEQITSETMIGITLTLLTVRTFRETQLPVIIVGAAQELPPLLNTAEFTSAEKLAVRLSTRTAIRKKWIEDDFRLSAHCQAGVGYWLEVGPAEGKTWNGALVGADISLGGSIDFQAVGPKGSMPERTVLDYPVRDARLSAGDREYLAWGCQNQLTDADSFYVRIKGLVPSLLLSEGLSSDDSMDCRVIRLA